MHPLRTLALGTATVLLVLATSPETTLAAAKKTTKKASSSVASVVRSSPALKANTSCNIKGNISTKTREKIYHVLGCPNYGQTVIDTTAGERMFCTEKEATAAGWRKALNCPR
jgi:hypothetical protein